MEKESVIRKLRSPEAFAELLQEHGMPLPVQADMAELGKPLEAGGKTIPNRICIQPLEGYDSRFDGSPSDLVYRRYRRFAGSGAGLIWFESAAVAEDGKSNPHQMMLSPERISDFGALLEEMDRISLEQSGFRQYKALQLTHSGRVSRGPDWQPQPLAARRQKKDTGNILLATDDRICRLIEETVCHAVMAKEAGFDAVDVKACHGYFLGEMLSAFERKGAFGGSFENRTKALLAIVDGIREKVGGSLALTVRLNAYDSLPDPEGWGLKKEGGVLVPDLAEPVRLCRILKDKGVRIINISASQPCRHLFGPPADETVAPFADAWDLLMAVKEIKNRVPGMAFVCSGLSQFRQFGPAIGAGGIRDGWFDLAGFGRQALAYPAFARTALAGQMPEPDRCCVLCSSCFKLMFPGLSAAGCVVRDPDPYASFYRKNVLNKENGISQPEEMMMKEQIDVFDYSEQIMKALRRGILLNTNGDKFNSMVISWGHFGIIWGEPTFVVYVREHRYTKPQLDKTMEFTLSIPLDKPDLVISRVCGSLSGRSVDKVAEAKLTLVDPETNSTPAVAEYPLTLECKVLYTQKQDLSLIPEDIRKRDYPQDVDGTAPLANRDPHTAYIGKIVNAYIIRQ